MEAKTEIGMALDEFIRLYDTEGAFELINGERIPKMPNIAGHGEIVELIFLAIHALVSAKMLGKVVREMPFVLSYTSNWVTGSRVPDLMYFRAERFNPYQETTPDWKDKPYILIPDLVVEVVSPNDNLWELDEKVDLYLADGILLVWVIDPQRKKVSVYTPAAPHTRQQTNLKSGDTLTGGDIIPGFEIAIDAIFA